MLFECLMNLGSRTRMKLGSLAGGLSEGERSSSGRTTGHDVRELGDMPSLATRRVGMSVHGGGWQSRGVLIIMGKAKSLMGLLPKSMVMVSHRPALCHSSRERSKCRALLFRSCRRHFIEGSYPPCGR
jgi:hypothetical protein